jgi:hypothetical protein
VKKEIMGQNMPEQPSVLGASSAPLADRITPPAEIMFNADCRIENMIWLPGLPDEDAFPDVFRTEFVESMPERADAPLFASLPQLARFAEDDDYPEPCEVMSPVADGPKGQEPASVQVDRTPS